MLRSRRAYINTNFMSRISKRSLSRSAVAAYSCVCAALLLLLALTIWGSYRDVYILRSTLLEAEIDRVRSHAERTAGRIERDLEIRRATSLGELDGESWLETYWQRLLPDEQRQLYAAVVDRNGQVLLHSDPSREGKRLAGNWYDQVLYDIGSDVVKTRSSVLALSGYAYDVRMPIEVDGQELGEYHSGFDVDWFNDWRNEKQADFLKRRLLLNAGVLSIVLLAATSLYFIATHSITLGRAVDSASLERATEVGRLAAGLAHEIRNPLHAIGLNLHSFRRVQQHEAELPRDEIAKMLEQSTREIERIEHLMNELVGFAAPEEPRDEVIDLTKEIRDVVDFIQQEMLDKNVEIETRLPQAAVRATMDRGRLRQIMLNLLQNAQQAMVDGGRIEVGLARRRGRAEITVADNGPGIGEDERTRVFEPFYSTKSDGTGFGLALVKRFIDQVGGVIRCETNADGGATIRIDLEEVK